MSRRRARLNEQLKREVSEILTRKVRDPRVEGVRVTDAQVSADLWLARIFVRLPASAAGRKEALTGLSAAASFVRRQLGQTLRLRRVPELRFEEDRTQDEATRIEQLLSEVLPDTPAPDPDQPTPDSEEAPSEPDQPASDRDPASDSL